jgi:hypothetical protein
MRVQFKRGWCAAMVGHRSQDRSLPRRYTITSRRRLRPDLTHIYLGVAAAAVVSLGGFASTLAHAGEKGEKEPLAIVELGGSGEWAFTGQTSVGSSVAVEFEPIKDWLEIEVGTGPLFGKDHAHWDTDLLFKKPFILSDKVEFMVGAGPQWSQSFNGGGALGAEFALDFMIWPTKDRKFGWFVEPTYSYSFGSEHEQSLGMSLGLLIPIQPN